MRHSYPKLLETLCDNHLITDQVILYNIKKRALALLKLNRAVQHFLPAQLHPWCRVRNVRQGVLILEVANASWMMRLRYEQSILLSTLKEKILPSLSSIDIKIYPGLIQAGNNQSKNATPSALLPRLNHKNTMELSELALSSPENLRKY